MSECKHVWELITYDDNDDPDLFYQCDFCGEKRKSDFIYKLEKENKELMESYKHFKALSYTLKGQLSATKERLVKTLSFLEGVE